MATDEKPESDKTSNMSGKVAFEVDNDIGSAEQNIDIEKQTQDQRGLEPATGFKEPEHDPNIVEFE